MEGMWEHLLGGPSLVAHQRICTWVTSNLVKQKNSRLQFRPQHTRTLRLYPKSNPWELNECEESSFRLETDETRAGKKWINQSGDFHPEGTIFMTALVPCLPSCYWWQWGVIVWVTRDVRATSDLTQPYLEPRTLVFRKCQTLAHMPHWAGPLLVCSCRLGIEKLTAFPTQNPRHLFLSDACYLLWEAV